MNLTFVPDPNAVVIPTGSRYRKVEPGFMPYPYKCTGCGSSDRACVDLDFQLTDDKIQRGRIGAVLLCTQCFRNAADVMGYIPVELAELNVITAVDQIMKEDAQRKLAELYEASSSLVENLKDRLDAYNVLRTAIFADNNNSSSDIEIEMDMEPPSVDGDSGEDSTEDRSNIERTGDEGSTDRNGIEGGNAEDSKKSKKTANESERVLAELGLGKVFDEPHRSSGKSSLV